MHTSPLLSSLIALSAAEKPNIIFFLVDDYDKPETSPYGGKALTPNLDRLAAEGMLFNNAYVSPAPCAPPPATRCLPADTPAPQQPRNS